MLSTEVIKNPSQAGHYFLSKDNYYTKESTLEEYHSQWWGKGASALGLSGSVDSGVFTQLLAGTLPDGQVLGVMKDGKMLHRPGFDLTLSVPKSVSLLALIGEDTRIFKAVERATDKALSLIERDLAKARMMCQGQTIFIATGNLTVARFLHDISRGGDPQLHTHCVVMNMTQDAGGRWRSLASQMGYYGAQAQRIPEGFLEAARHHKKYYGAVFRAELAYEMKQLGYEIVKVGNQGFFEIAGICAESIQAFSERRQMITDLMAEQGLSGAKAAAVATLITRPSKTHVRREDLSQVWHSKSAALAVDVFTEAKSVVARALAVEPLPIDATLAVDALATAKRALTDAVAHVSFTHVTLSETELLHHALQYSVGHPVSMETLLQAMDGLKKSGVLIPVPAAVGHSGEPQFTTAKLLGYEQVLLSAIAQPHPSGQGLLRESSLQGFMQQTQLTLNREQQAALRTLFGSDRQMMALAGCSGSGKTYLLKPIMTLAPMAGYQPILLTSRQAQRIDAKNDIQRAPENLREWLQSLFDRKQFMTIAGFLYRQTQMSVLEHWLQKKPLVIIDDANLVSLCQLHDVLQQVQRLAGRLILVGDCQSTLTWQAGSPLTQLVKHGITTAQLTENLRQHTAAMQAAVANTLQGQIAQAFDKLGQRIVSIADKSRCLENLAAHYLGLSAQARDETLLLLPSNALCTQVNAMVHSQRQALGELGATTAVLTLQPHYMSAVAQRYAQHYQPGQWLRFEQDFRSLRVGRGGYRQVHRVDRNSNTVWLIDEKCQTKAWNPARVAIGKVAIFDVQTREIAQGETLFWRHHDRQRGLHQGQRLKVTAVREQGLTLLTAAGKTIQLNLDDPSARHLDYGYAATPLQTYHLHPNTVIAYQSSASRQSHQRSFYQLLGQAKQQAWIYTDHKGQLLAKLQQHSGNKLTAIEALIGNTDFAAATYLDRSDVSNVPKTSDPSPAPSASASFTFTSTYITLVEQAVARAIQTAAPQKNSLHIAQDAVRYALAHLTEREAAFDHKALMAAAFRYASGDANMQMIEQAVTQAEQAGELIRGIYSRDGTHWTTRTALDQEQQILTLAKQDQGQLTALVNPTVVNAYLDQVQPSAEQRQVLHGILTQPDRVLLLQGFAGTGKTTLLIQVQTILTASSLSVAESAGEHSQQLLCLAPTHTAVKELRNRDLNGQTLDQFLTDFRAKKLPDSQPHVLIAVDESSMVSNRRMLDFLSAVHAVQARAIIIGDTQQYPAIEAGKPFSCLQKAGLATFYLQEITRQKEDTLKAAVHSMYQGAWAQVFELLEKRIVAVGRYEVDGNIKDNREQRLEAIRDDYMARDPLRRAQTLIVTFGNTERVLQNALIREQLAAQGELYGKQLVTQVLVAKQMTEAERSRTNHYQIGDVLRFSSAHPRLGIEQGQYLRVVANHAQQNRLTLEDSDGTPVLWQPATMTADARGGGVEVYQPEAREIMAGDLLRWTRTDKALGLLSPELALVKQVDGQTVFVTTVQLTPEGIKPEGAMIALQPQQSRFQHWDHAYAMTGYSAQGKTVAEVIIHAESFRPHLTSQPSVLVAITRAVNQLTLYTDDKQKLLTALLSNAGLKTSALEATGAFPYPAEATQLSLTDLNRHNRPTPTPITVAATVIKPAKAGSLETPLPTADTVTLPTSVTPKAPATPLLDANRVIWLLNNRTEDIVTQLLGEPKSSDANHYRYGRHHGSLIISLQGDKRGLWHDFQTGEGGNLLQLIAREQGRHNKRDFKAVLQSALQLLGIAEQDMTVAKSLSLLKSKQNSHANATPSHPPQSKILTPTQQKSLSYARQLARESQPIANTLAARYLQQHRHIQLDKFPDSIRFHPGVYSHKNQGIYPALLVVAKDNAQKIQAVQAIFLDPNTAHKADVLVKKQTWGMPSHAAALLGQPSPQQRTYLAEGLETGLSVYMALNGGDVRITFGKSNFKHIDTDTTPTKQIVLCLDNDGHMPNADKFIHFAAEKLQAEGKTVWIAQPTIAGDDFNDVLKKQGLVAVKQAIDSVLSYGEYRQPSLKTVTEQTPDTHAQQQLNTTPTPTTPELTLSKNHNPLEL